MQWGILSPFYSFSSSSMSLSSLLCLQSAAGPRVSCSPSSSSVTSADYEVMNCHPHLTNLPWFQGVASKALLAVCSGKQCLQNLFLTGAPATFWVCEMVVCFSCTLLWNTKEPWSPMQCPQTQELIGPKMSTTYFFPLRFSSFIDFPFLAQDWSPAKYQFTYRFC